MSPNSLPVRPVWILSLPAVAVLISFLWFRKKRGALETDRGGAGDNLNNNSKSVYCLENNSDLIEKSNVDDTADTTKDSSEYPDLESECAIDLSTKVATELIPDNITQLEEETISSVLDDTADLAVVTSTTEDPILLDKSTELLNIEKTRLFTEEIIEEVGTNSASQDDTFKEVTIDSTHEDLKEIAINEIKPEVEVLNKKEDKPNLELKTESLNKVSKDTKLVKEPAKRNIVEVSVKKTELAETSSSTSTPLWVKKKRMKKGAKGSRMADDKIVDSTTQNGILEKKLTKLDLANKETASPGNERDSANNSPSEVMLGSPSCSACSDTRSEGSSDSGKGCSEVRTPSPTPVSGNSVSGDLPTTTLYEFCIPQQLVGRLIGRNGSYIHEIMDNTHATIFIKRHPETPKLKICAIEGTQMDIENALDMIRQKFPKKRYPNVTLEQIHTLTEVALPPVLSENMYIYLVEGITNDAMLSSLVSAGHFFLQQTFHPTYPCLGRLYACMKHCYNRPNQPLLPDDIQAGVLCAAPVDDGWYRAEIIAINKSSNPEDGLLCNVKFVDYGGYMTLPKSQLRQIRGDFTTLPFQAAECYLASVAPISEDGSWSEEAKNLVENFTYGKVVHAQVFGYAENGVPLIHLYVVNNNQLIFINQELVTQGFAVWLVPEDNQAQDIYPSDNFGQFQQQQIQEEATA